MSIFEEIMRLRILFFCLLWCCFAQSMHVFHFNLALLRAQVDCIKDEAECVNAILEQARVLLSVLENIDMHDDEVSLFLHQKENAQRWGSHRFFCMQHNLFGALCSVIMQGKILLGKLIDDPDYLHSAVRFLTGLLLQLGYVENLFLTYERLSFDQIKTQILYNYQALSVIIPYSSQRHNIKVYLYEKDEGVRLLLGVRSLRRLYACYFGTGFSEKSFRLLLQKSLGRYDEVVFEE